MTSTTSDHDKDAFCLLTKEELDERDMHYEPPPETVCPYCKKPREYLAATYKNRVFWVGQGCGCEGEKNAQAAEKTREKALEKAEQARKLREVGILPRYQNAVLDDPDAARFLSQFDAMPGEGLYIIGVCGSGKTSLACAIAQALHEERRRVLVTTAIEMLDEIKDTFDNNDSTSAAIDKFIACDLLVIDDMGKESAGDWTIRTLFQILNRRYGEMKSTIITSEYEPADLGRRMGRQGFGDPATAILSRIKETCKRIKRPDIDFRNMPGGYVEYRKTYGTG